MKAAPSAFAAGAIGQQFLASEHLLLGVGENGARVAARGDLMEMGLAWGEGAAPRAELARETRERFRVRAASGS